MKKLLLGAAAALAVAAPGMASAETSGNIDVSIGNTDWDNGSEFDTTTLGGAVQFDAMDGWAVSLEGRTVLQQWDGSSGDSSHGYAAVHADTNAGAWDFGGWVGLLNYYGDGGTTIGLETRTNFGNFSAQGSIGLAQFDQFFDYDAMNYNVQGAYFFTPNFSVNGNVTITEIDYTFGDTDMTDYGIGAAYGFGGGFEVYGGYVKSEMDYSGGGNDETDTFNLGLRFHFNGGTLQDYANDGASWGGVRAISDAFTRWD
ncbi:hypothetical protein [Candidatus Viadribacter manganicus]|uniref:Outer membrane protein beta-barrel domain-containing protein n=1 Tax=Candidatus Viadribacter manganicus TaxID=1759059 RepID=A0A1B1AK79_9PROT|nr:hypothetical protein [Candidatus Viadribacter manganicus]ANP46974.1 hypothetical protein ATE48_14140 [Candidatus Viadribacter manganicus]